TTLSSSNLRNTRLGTAGYQRGASIQDHVNVGDLLVHLWVAVSPANREHDRVLRVILDGLARGTFSVSGQFAQVCSALHEDRPGPMVGRILLLRFRGRELQVLRVHSH